MTDHAGPSPVTIEARGLVKDYPGVRALDGADLKVTGGSIMGLLGKNGAGKSTMIKILAGVVQPDGGQILVNGEVTPIANPKASDALGFAFVHQELADFPNLSVAENVMLGRGFPTRGGLVSRTALRRKAKAVLDRLEADINPARPLSSLSVAERRLVMIGHGLAADARLFVLDEPTASLTESEIEHLHRVLTTLRDHGVGIVYVSHRLDEIVSLTDRVEVMRDGKVVFSGATAAVSKTEMITQITGHQVIETRVPHAAPTTAEELLRVEKVSVDGVVHGASFVVRKGELLGIAGLVGAGRTELMRAVFGADRASSGQIFMHGKEVKIRSPRDGMSAGIVLLPEDRKTQGAVFTFSVRKNITLPAMSRYRASAALPFPSARRERAGTQELVDRLKIKVADVDAPARYLSGGNQQKMVLAKWLESGADVFVFDEPTHGIDVDGKEEVYEVMTRLAQAGKGVIFISSEFTELVGTCNRVLVMREGRLVKQFEGAEITDAALVGSCYSD
ncbi:MAG TPA: sugar ABC transporter ATP-binding protein [Solirubrobacteraceae bacterium]|nr:sugar ABC transporter ATP-binding protein [Solirubrobacteraceae bacterium]